MSKGFVTIPTDKTIVEETKKMIDYWGADAVRDCDGVSLPDNVGDFGCEVYKAYFIVREDHDYAKQHPEFLQSVALITKKITAFSDTLEINIMDGICLDTIVPNENDYANLWQVFDRTTGKETKDWTYLGKGIVRVNHPVRFHDYTVSFFGKNIWDPVQVYNYATNNWTIEKDVDVDPIYPEVLEHTLGRMENWLKGHPEVTVVRFTTFFYNFFIVYRKPTEQAAWDWHIYAMSASPKMFETFKKETGRDITLEDVVTGGTYGSRFQIPGETTKMYMDFVQKKCCGWAKMFVDLVHKYGKKAMMFDGDHRIGTEPYNPYFASIGLDAVVGAPHSGPYIRLLSDMTGVKYKEGRFAPYFFPNECPGDKIGTQILTNAWNSERRGMLRKPIDRIGFGGYLKQVLSYPNFIEKVKNVCDEFRLIKEKAGKEGSYCHAKIAIMSYWGRLNSWMCNGNFTDDAFQDGETYTALINAIAGQPVDVSFISYDDIVKGDILGNYDVIVNSGIPGTSFQGSDCWKNDVLVTKIREYVYNGGGFIGFGEPSGCQNNGKYIQLGDVLGIEKECGFTYYQKRFMKAPSGKHWISEGVDLSKVEYSRTVRSIYSTGAEIIAAHFDQNYPREVVNTGHVDFAVNEYGKGRSVYFSGLMTSYEAYRLVYRSILWASHKEEKVQSAFSTDIRTDCYYYEKDGTYAVLNNTGDAVSTTFYDIRGNASEILLEPHEIRWINK